MGFEIANFWIDFFCKELSMDITIKLNVILFIIIIDYEPRHLYNPKCAAVAKVCQQFGDDTVAIATDHRWQSFSLRSKKAGPQLGKKAKKKGVSDTVPIATGHLILTTPVSPPLPTQNVQRWRE